MTDAELLESIAKEIEANAVAEGWKGDRHAEKLRAIAARLAAPPPADFGPMVVNAHLAMHGIWDADYDVAPTQDCARNVLAAAGVPQLLAEATRLREQRTVLAAALRSLRDAQNGPPLPKYEGDWHDAMNRSGMILDEVEPEIAALAAPPET
jgi:hypothetical protein